MNDAKLVCLCILILSGAFTLLSLGFLLLRIAGVVKESTILMTMLETTIQKSNTILDDVNHKLEMLDAPVELVSGVFSKGGLKATLLASFGFFTSLFRKKR